MASSCIGGGSGWHWSVPGGSQQPWRCGTEAQHQCMVGMGWSWTRESWWSFPVFMILWFCALQTVVAAEVLAEISHCWWLQVALVALSAALCSSVLQLSVVLPFPPEVASRMLWCFLFPAACFIFCWGWSSSSCGI